MALTIILVKDGLTGFLCKKVFRFQKNGRTQDKMATFATYGKMWVYLEFLAYFRQKGVLIS